MPHFRPGPPVWAGAQIQVGEPQVGTKETDNQTKTAPGMVFSEDLIHPMVLPFYIVLQYPSVCCSEFGQNFRRFVVLMEIRPCSLATHDMSR